MRVKEFQKKFFAIEPHVHKKKRFFFSREPLAVVPLHKNVKMLKFLISASELQDFSQMPTSA